MRTSPPGSRKRELLRVVRAPMMDWQMTALLKLISSVLDETSHAVRGPSVFCHAAVYEQVPVGCDEGSWNGPAPRLTGGARGRFG